MANICYMAVVVDSKESFEILHNRIDSVNEKTDSDFMGFAYWCNKYIFRFESKWEPDLKVPQILSKGLSTAIEFWYQESLTGLAGKRIYENGKTIEKSNIDCDIRDMEMRRCLYYTDWEGINWDSSCHNSKFCINVRGEHRHPDILTIELRTFTDNGEVICAKEMVGEYDSERFNVVFNTFYAEPEKVWEEHKKYMQTVID